MTTRYKPYIFIDTQFVRRNETIISLACMEQYRRISLPLEICEMERGQQIECLTQFVRQHQMTLSDGKIKLWGKPVKYVAHIATNLVIEILPTGEFIREIHEDVTNSGASLKVGGRLIAGVEGK